MSIPQQNGTIWSQLSLKTKAVVTTAVGAVVTIGALAGTPGPAGSLDTINGCAISGDAPAQSDHGVMNELKNRYSSPSDEDMDPKATLDALAQAPNETDFDQQKSAVITGWVTEVKRGGTESCNCKTTDPRYMDTHIFVGPSSNSPKTQCIVVEVTPRVRELLSQQGIDWSTESLIPALTGQYVRVVGWLFYDKEHTNASEANQKGRATNWRASCWEIHPVTELDILPKPASP